MGQEKGRSSSESTKQQDAIFNELMQECKYSAPGARLSARLRTALERMSPSERRAVCDRKRDGCAPLFVACRRGNVEIVEYLVHVCACDLEQRGLYEVPDERSVHHVTPLWAAAVSGSVDAVRVLAEAGALIDAPSDSGSTPVRSACFMTHMSVVRYLVQRGADIHRPNHNGGTCLINSVQSVRLCAFLLDRGVAVDARDSQHKTVLHYAIQEHRLETVRLLLERGADPSLTTRSGDDALRTACLKGAASVVRMLTASVPYERERLADSYELLGATLLDEFNDPQGCLAAWRRATALRHSGAAYLRKRRADGVAVTVGAGTGGGAAVAGALRDGVLWGEREWRTAGELQAMEADTDALRTQALLVSTRVLGPCHKDTIFRLMYRGASYADQHHYERCMELWTWALELRVQHETVLSGDTCHVAAALTRLLLDARSGRLDRALGLPTHAAVLAAYRALADPLLDARPLLAVRPVMKAQLENFDRVLRCVSHLVFLLVHCARGPAEVERTVRAVRRLVRGGVRTAHTKDTLLHLCVSRLNTVRSTYFGEDGGVLMAGPLGAHGLDAYPADAPPPDAVFPCVRVVRLLLACGAAPDALNEARSTALHVAAVPYNFSTELVEALVAAGAHLDRPNKFGDSAMELVSAQRRSRVCPLRHVTLACAAARVLAASSRAGVVPRPHRLLPTTLRRFLEMHEP